MKKHLLLFLAILTTIICFGQTGAPAITSFTPASATPGTTVTITGTNLLSTKGVSFGGVAAAAYKVVSATSVIAVVPVTTSGDVSLTNAVSTATAGGFTYIPSNLPTITDLSGPMSGTMGGSVVIMGVNLRTATSVTFGGVPVLNFEPYSLDPDRALFATIGPGASGDIVVTNPAGTSTLPGFTYIPSTKPYITSVVPSSGPPGTAVTINGYNLNGISSLSIGKVAATSFTINSATKITAVVGLGYSDYISFDGPNGGVADGNSKFTITASPAPAITSFSPTSAAPGTMVTITGTNLGGTTSVRFGGVAGIGGFKIINSTTITAFVPVTTSGDISLTSSSGTITAGGFTYIPSNLPVITAYGNLLPGTLGDYVNVIGVNLRNATAVSFGGVPALSFEPYNLDPDRALLIVIGPGASGDISVTNPFGTATLPGFIYSPSTKPYITSISPTSGPPGTTVTINGYNLGSVSSVTIGDRAAVSFTVVSPTSITAVVGPTAQSGVSVTSGTGQANGAFTVTAPPPPTITSFTPASATPGTIVTITGTNFSGVKEVKFGGVRAATYKVISTTSVTAMVPVTTSGDVSLTNATGTTTAGGFTYIPSGVPTITDFTPDNMMGTLGATVFISGVNLRTATSVTFGGVPALSFEPYELGSDNALLVTVGPGASGNIVVTNSSGTATMPGFIYTPSTGPYVTSVSPTSGPPGTTITVNGYNLANATSVTINGVKALSYSALSSTTLTAVVSPESIGTGSVTVTNPSGTNRAAPKFTLTAPAVPLITSFTPASVIGSATVTITGANFVGVIGVSFGGVAAASFTVVSPTSITAMPALGTSGNISVTTFGGTANLGGFTYVPVPAPTITSFTPTSASPGTTVTLTGTNLTGATAVSFGGVAASSFTVVSPTSITAVVVAGASGSIAVTTPGGIATLAGFTYMPVPIVGSFTPLIAATGTMVTITGANFAGTSAVSFGGTAASSFTLVSPTSITAVVGVGASGTVAVTNGSGQGTKTGFTYFPVPTVTASGTTEVNIGSSVTLTTPANAAYAYVWSKDGLPISGATTNTYAASQTGSYTVAVTTTGGLYAIAVPVNIHVSLPPSNFNVLLNSAVCKGSTNGSIKITAGINLNYTVKIIGTGVATTTYPFTSTVTISNLPAGNYSLYINVTGTPGYEQYFAVKITEPKDLAVYSAINKNTNSVDLTLDGGTVYNIKINGTSYTTTGNNITLPLTKGTNNIAVTTDLPCQGVIEKRIVISDNITAYPNPFERALTLNLGDKAVAKAQAQVYNSSGKQVFSKQYINQSGDIVLDLSTLEPTQVYVLKLTVDNTEYINKIIKK